MQQYNVTGMSCAACSARVEKAVNAVPGVSACAVSLLTNSMGVEGTADAAAVIAAVEAAGYGASVKGAAPDTPLRETVLEDRQTPALRRRLLCSLALLAVLMYVSMGHNMWDWPLPSALADNCLSAALVQLLLTAAIMVINQRFFTSGFKAVLHGAPNMDTLVALGSGAAFIYSCYALFAMSAAMLSGGEAAAAAYTGELYFESAAMILTLITVGKTLEARAKGKTTDALKGLMQIAPKTASLVMPDGSEKTVPVGQVKKGDVFTVRPGESIPVDGVILDGTAAVDEAALTGESIPVDKSRGDTVSAATVDRDGYLRCEATRVGEDTALAQIIKLVSDASATKAPIARIADKVSGVFVPAVIGIALVTAAVWLILGQSVGYAVARGISVLVISCPCALGLATPVAIMVGSGVGARHGILFKTAASLEAAGKISIAALDKTGTVTEGKPRVTDVIPAPGQSAEELLTLAYSVEVQSEHPLAGAVTAYAREHGTELRTAENFRALPGSGLTATVDGAEISAGSASFVLGRTAAVQELSDRAASLSSEGKTPLFFACGDRLLGLIAVADTVKPESAAAIHELKNMGIRVVMLTGDNERTAKAIGSAAGVDEVIAGVLPDGKERVICTLARRGKVAMVGDGINDAPALTRADTGIAIGAGTDIAIDAADIVLMHSRLTDVPAAIRLSRAALRNIRQNLFWAFFYNCIGIPIAAGVFAPLGLTLSPMIGAAAMSLSSFCVVTNALRLNLCDIYSTKHDRKIKQIRQREELSMTRTMKIEGMMCPHCEARVKKALEAIEGVESAVPSHTAGTAVVTLCGSVSDEALKAAVEAQDYKVLGIE